MDILYGLSHLMYAIFVQNWIGLLTALITTAILGCVRLAWSSLFGWMAERRKRKENKELEEEWKQSLALRSLKLSQSGKLLQSKRRLVTSERLLASSKSPLIATATCSSKAHKGNNGLWAELCKGPNIQLIEVRDSLGLTRYEAAEKLNVEEQELGRWERGQCVPTRDMLSKICEGYGVSSEALGYSRLEAYYAKHPLRSQKRRQLTE